MIHRKSLLASGVAAAILAASGAGAATLQTGHVASVSNAGFTNSPNAGAAVLYDQTAGLSSNGATFQDFESSYDAYDNEEADDFVVPAAGWSISSIDLVTTTSQAFTGATTAIVNFYPDAGGTPGAAAVCSYPAAPMVVSASTSSITLPTDCALGAGTYWVGISTSLDFGSSGQIFWTNSTIPANSNASWRNPGDGFGTGCTNWGTLIDCGIGGGVDPSAAFRLLGTEGTGGPTLPPEPYSYVPVPTLSQWALALLGAGLAFLSFRARRRQGSHD